MTGSREDLPALNNKDFTERSWLHQILIRPLVLERLPRWLVLVASILLILGVGLLWGADRYAMVAAFHVIVLMIDFASLIGLPRFERSFGPVHPPLIGLTLLRVTVTSLIGLGVRQRDSAIILMAVFQIALLAVTLYGLWIEPFRLTISYQQLSSGKLANANPPLTIVHLGDLHLERETIRERCLQELLEHLAPDVIIFSGDFVNLSYNQDSRTAGAIQQVISQWKATYGVYAVSGSPLVETQEAVRGFLDGTDIRWLRDDFIELQIRRHRLTIIGVTCHHDVELDTARARAVIEETSPESFRLLVYHSPDIAPRISQLGIDLYLCGHTHGGQWRLPGYGALITSSALGKRFEMGRYKLGQMVLYVTRGIGLEGASAPRARLLCPPEIVHWTIT